MKIKYFAFAGMLSFIFFNIMSAPMLPAKPNNVDSQERKFFSIRPPFQSYHEEDSLDPDLMATLSAKLCTLFPNREIGQLEVIMALLSLHQEEHHKKNDTRQ